MTVRVGFRMRVLTCFHMATQYRMKVDHHWKILIPLIMLWVHHLCVDKCAQGTQLSFLSHSTVIRVKQMRVYVLNTVNVAGHTHLRIMEQKYKIQSVNHRYVHLQSVKRNTIFPFKELKCLRIQKIYWINFHLWSALFKWNFIWWHFMWKKERKAYIVNETRLGRLACWTASSPPPIAVSKGPPLKPRYSKAAWKITVFEGQSMICFCHNIT
jgi:hypothetical protein